MRKASQKSKVFRLAILACFVQLLQGQEFSRDIAPIFAANCIGCHASNVKMGSLDLDTMEGIKAGGNHGTVLVPGNSAESRLYLMVAGKASPAMPLSGKQNTGFIIGALAGCVTSNVLRGRSTKALPHYAARC